MNDFLSISSSLPVISLRKFSCDRALRQLKCPGTLQARQDIFRGDEEYGLHYLRALSQENLRRELTGSALDFGKKSFISRRSLRLVLVNELSTSCQAMQQRVVNNCQLMKTYCKELPAYANNPTASFQRVTTCCKRAQRARQRASALGAMGS